MNAVPQPGHVYGESPSVERRRKQLADAVQHGA